jgi:hypothetical protein
MFFCVSLTPVDITEINLARDRQTVVCCTDNVFCLISSAVPYQLAVNVGEISSGRAVAGNGYAYDKDQKQNIPRQPRENFAR